MTRFATRSTRGCVDSGPLTTISAVEVLGPKGPALYGGADMLTWARNQLDIAGQIMDNPGGGLLFATQAIGQVRSALAESDGPRWREVVERLERAEDRAVRREFGRARELISEARGRLDQV